MKIRLPSIKIPYFLGLMVGYIFDLISIISEKNSISSVRVKKFCATTQFNARKHKEFKAPYTWRRFKFYA